MVVHTLRFDCFSVFESPNTGTRKIHINATRFEKLLRDLAIAHFKLASGHQYFFHYSFMIRFPSTTWTWSLADVWMAFPAAGAAPGLQHGGQRILNCTSLQREQQLEHLQVDHSITKYTVAPDPLPGDSLAGLRTRRTPLASYQVRARWPCAESIFGDFDITSA